MAETVALRRIIGGEFSLFHPRLSLTREHIGGTGESYPVMRVPGRPDDDGVLANKNDVPKGVGPTEIFGYEFCL